MSLSPTVDLFPRSPSCSTCPNPEPLLGAHPLQVPGCPGCIALPRGDLILPLLSTPDNFCINVILESSCGFFFWFFSNIFSALLFFFFFLIFIYLFMAVLGLRFCARAFSSCGKWGPLFIAVCGPLIIVASLVVEHRLQTHRLSNCGPRAQLPCGMWDPPRPGLEPVFPASAGRLSTTAPPGKPCSSFF